MSQPGEKIWEDQHQIVTPAGCSTGYEGMFRPGFSSTAVEDFPDSLLIPESDWPGLISQMEADKSRLSDIIVQAGLPPKNQQQTSYCWINAPTGAVETLRAVANEPMVILSPASAGGPITGFKDVGGWGEDGLKWIVDHGLCPVTIWPPNAISKIYYTTANQQVAMDYRVTEWWRLEPRNMQQLISCLLRRIPVAVGYNYWRHEVLAVDAVMVNGRIGVRIRNSWGDQPDWPNGFGVLTGNKAVPDDAVAPRQAIAS